MTVAADLVDRAIDVAALLAPRGDVASLLAPRGDVASPLAPIGDGAALLAPSGDVAEDAAAASGGVVLFVGAVRDHTRGKRVLRLEYEAYAPMARKELLRVAEEACQRFSAAGVTIVHRVGVLRPGEAAVAIVARAAHRAAAFDACRFAIDELKRSVPIWKKEVFEDGEVWVGERP